MTSTSPAAPVNEILTRTREGVEALRDSLAASLQEPERIGYLTAGELSVWSRLFGWEKPAAVAVAATMPALAGTVVRHDASPVLLAGLAGGWIGDLAKLRKPERTPVLGMFGIAAQHAAYSAKLYDRGARPSPTRVGLRAAAWATGVGLAAWKKKSLIAPSVVAGVFVAATSALADDRGLQDGTVVRQGLGHGGNLLLAAEGIALLRETVLTGDSLGYRALDAGMRATHVVGNMLLIDGLTRE
ncbi:lysoplasmalogenase family protein [Corynebacterium sp.]|uniref:lysoplasmalogenase family protein n=1 Tax=Corynebacterium sp. TaxID=1720 RepID=UPI0026E0AE99|nr:lysoplasmalogenase family protein [Corynebacterium sp.]MDO5513285.1 lysoplasmalogenase family protein [Corynebacterium sp.]